MRAAFRARNPRIRRLPAIAARRDGDTVTHAAPLAQPPRGRCRSLRRQLPVVPPVGALRPTTRPPSSARVLAAPIHRRQSAARPTRPITGRDRLDPSRRRRPRERLLRCGTAARPPAPISVVVARHRSHAVSARIARPRLPFRRAPSASVAQLSLRSGGFALASPQLPRFLAACFRSRTIPAM